MTKNNGYLYVAMIVIILMGAIISVQHGEIQKSDVNNMPDCKYSITGQAEGQGIIGYWIGTNQDHEPSCIARVGY
jgi:hypothetical protein